MKVRLTVFHFFREGLAPLSRSLLLRQMLIEQSQTQSLKGLLVFASQCFFIHHGFGKQFELNETTTRYAEGPLN